MFCQKCHAPMRYTYVGHSQSTIELWACTADGCDYTFELRSNARGFHFCFMQEEDLSYHQAQTPLTQKSFPDEVFAVGTGQASFAGAKS